MLLKGQRLKLFYKVHPVSHEPPSLPGVGCVTLADLSHFHWKDGTFGRSCKEQNSIFVAFPHCAPGWSFTNTQYWISCVCRAVNKVELRSVCSVNYKHEGTDSQLQGRVTVTWVSATVSLCLLSSSLPSAWAEDHRPWPRGQQPYSGGFQREVWSLFLPEPSETKIQSLPFCMCPPATALWKVWEKWRWEMFSMPPCCNRVTGRQMAVSQEENKQMRVLPEMGYMLFFFHVFRFGKI